MIEYNLSIKDAHTSLSKKDTYYEDVLNEKAKEFFKNLEMELEKKFNEQRGYSEDAPDKVLKIKMVI